MKCLTQQSLAGRHAERQELRVEGTSATCTGLAPGRGTTRCSGSAENDRHPRRDLGLRAFWQLAANGARGSVAQSGELVAICREGQMEFVALLKLHLLGFLHD